MAVYPDVVPFSQFDNGTSMTRLFERGGTYYVTEIRRELKTKTDGEEEAWCHARVIDTDTGELVGVIHTPGVAATQLFEVIDAGMADSVIGPVRVIQVGRVKKFEAV